MSEHYAAFISYSHRDARWAKWLQRTLEVYRLPAGLSSQRQLPRRLGKVFRDREELSTGQNLGDHLTRALDQSDNLIVICSPNACASPWVAKEIGYFKAQGKTDRIFCLLVEGGAEALPEPLLTDAEGKPLEPLAADPRDSGDGRTLAKLKLVSGMLGLNLDQLTQREQARARRRGAGMTAAMAGVSALFVWGVLSQQAYQEEQRDAFEVVRNLTPLMTQSTDYIDKETLSKAGSALNSWVQRIDNNSPIEGAVEVKARGMHSFAFASYELGKKKDSLDAYLKAKELFAQASEGDSENVDLAIDLASADFYIGSVFFYDGDYEQARVPFEAYRQGIAKLFAQHPDHPRLISESIDAPATALANLSGLKNVFDEELAEGVAEVDRAIAKVLKQTTNQHEVYRAAYAAITQAAEAELKSCFVNDALTYREQAAEYARQALNLDPFNRDYKINLSNALYSLGGTHMLLAKPAKAVPLYLQVDTLSDELLRGDPNNKYLADRKLRNRLQLLAVATYHPELMTEFPLAEKIITTTNFTAEAEELGELKTSMMSHFHSAMYALSVDDLVLAKKQVTQLLKAAKQMPAGRAASDVAFGKVIMAILKDELSSESLTTITSSSGGDTQSCIKRRQYWAEAILRGDYDAAKAIYDEAASLGLVGLEIPFFAKLLGLSYETPGAQ